MNSTDDNSYQSPEGNLNEEALPDLRSSLIAWFDVYGRDFPWRKTSNSFHILLAEMMLRRTQARQVVTVYNNFITSYPEPVNLTKAPSGEVAVALYSLGLAWRVPAFQLLASELVERFNGVVPSVYEELLSLPGVGDYVASAVCCFAFNEPRIIADTNTVRVAGRIFKMATHAESRRRKSTRQLLEFMLDRKCPRPYSYALLDLAASICLPTNPICNICPINRYCKTGQERLS